MALSGRFTEALRAFDMAIRQDANFAAAYIGRGVCHHKLGRPGKALDDIRRAALLGSQGARNYLVQIDAIYGLTGETEDIRSSQAEKVGSGKSKGSAADAAHEDESQPLKEGREATLSGIKRLIKEINQPLAKQPE
jgi:tetratricopeptide (TPR) repeat protein